MNDFKVFGTLPNGQKMQILCEKKQLPMVTKMLKQQGCTGIKVEPDFNYGK